MLFILGKISLSPKQRAGDFENCSSLSTSDKNGISILFFADREKAEQYKQYLLSVTPFDRFTELISFYYIDGYVPACELYQGIALFCYSTDLVKKAASCPHDYIVVLGSKEASIRSSSYLNVMSLNDKHPLSVFAHEFGHAFGSLAEEYNPAPLSPYAKNCVKNCSNFKFQTDGCFQGCSRDDYYRSIETGVMRTLSSNKYGVFDEHLLETIMGNQVPGSISGKVIDEPVLSDCSQEKYYLIVGNYTKENITVVSRSIEKGCPTSLGNGPFNYTLVGARGIVAQNAFDPETVYTDAPGKAAISSIQGKVIENGEENLVPIDGGDYSRQGTIAFTVPLSGAPQELVVTNPQGNTVPFIFNGNKEEGVRLQDIGARACRIS